MKRIAEEHDWSLAEVIRRASELYAARYPARRTTDAGWRLPQALDLGETLVDAAEIRVEAEATLERTPG